MTQKEIPSNLRFLFMHKLSFFLQKITCRAPLPRSEIFQQKKSDLKTRIIEIVKKQMELDPKLTMRSIELQLQSWIEFPGLNYFDGSALTAALEDTEIKKDLNDLFIGNSEESRKAFFEEVKTGLSDIKKGYYTKQSATLTAFIDKIAAYGLKDESNLSLLTNTLHRAFLRFKISENKHTAENLEVISSLNDYDSELFLFFFDNFFSKKSFFQHQKSFSFREFLFHVLKQSCPKEIADCVQKKFEKMTKLSDQDLVKFICMHKNFEYLELSSQIENYIYYANEFELLLPLNYSFTSFQKISNDRRLKLIQCLNKRCNRNFEKHIILHIFLSMEDDPKKKSDFLAVDLGMNIEKIAAFFGLSKDQKLGFIFDHTLPETLSANLLANKRFFDAFSSYFESKPQAVFDKNLSDNAQWKILMKLGFSFPKSCYPIRLFFIKKPSAISAAYLDLHFAQPTNIDSSVDETKKIFTEFCLLEFKKMREIFSLMSFPSQSELFYLLNNDQKEAFHLMPIFTSAEEKYDKLFDTLTNRKNDLTIHILKNLPAEEWRVLLSYAFNDTQKGYSAQNFIECYVPNYQSTFLTMFPTLDAVVQKNMLLRYYISWGSSHRPLSHFLLAALPIEATVSLIKCIQRSANFTGKVDLLEFILKNLFDSKTLDDLLPLLPDQELSYFCRLSFGNRTHHIFIHFFLFWVKMNDLDKQAHFFRDVLSDAEQEYAFFKVYRSKDPDYLRTAANLWSVLTDPERSSLIPDRNEWPSEAA